MTDTMKPVKSNLVTTATLSRAGTFTISEGAIIAVPDTALPFTALAWVEGRWTGDGRFVMVDGHTPGLSSGDETLFGGRLWA